ncbi:MAG: SOS response-associated peptidase family protein [Terriglobia bacterium]
MSVIMTGYGSRIAHYRNVAAALRLQIVRTYCIITVPASGALAEIHDRMPLVLNEPDWPVWFGETPGDPRLFYVPQLTLCL